MANARFVLGTTGGQMEISESTGVTGVTGYGTIYASSVDNKLHYVDGSGNDIQLGVSGTSGTSGISITGPTGPSGTSGTSGISTAGELQQANTDSLLNCSYGNAALFGTSNATVSIGVCNNFCGGQNTSIAIGCCNTITSGNAQVIGDCNLGGDRAVIVGQGSCTGTWGVALSVAAKAPGQRAIAIGPFTNAPNGASVAIGSDAGASADCTIAIGKTARTSCTRAVAIGQSSCAQHIDAVSLGANVVSEREATTHVNSLLAYGQGVSKGHDIGSTGGTVTVDWDNSNTQKISLSSNITSLTLSNPIQGGVYSLIVEQTTSGGNTITWPAGAIKWPGGTPPTLTSGATGDTDVISLIYDPAGGTGYLGNANLAFS